MSIGEQKPGGNKMSDLKARLSALNKGSSTAAPTGPAAATPASTPAAAPKPAPATANKLNIDFNAAAKSTPAAAPKPAPATASMFEPAAPKVSATFPAAEPAAAPKATAKPAFALGGEDLFAAKPTTPASPPSEMASTFAPSAPAVEEPAAPSDPAAAFANPMQVGRFYEPAAPAVLSPEEEAELNAYEKGQKGIKPMMAYSIGGAIALIALIFGIFLGDSRYSRRMINSQIDSSVNLQKTLQPLFDKVNEVAPILKALPSSQQVDWEKMKALPKELPEIDAGALLATPVPLRKEVTQTLNKWLTDTNLLFAETRNHIYLTLTRDKVELENLEKGNSFWNNPETMGYAAKFDPPDPKDRKPGIRLLKGTFVAVMGQGRDSDDGNDHLMPVRYQTKEEMEEVPLRNLVILNKEELQSGGAGNALTNYQHRCQDIFTIIQRLEQTQTQLVELLKQEAERSKVFQF